MKIAFCTSCMNRRWQLEQTLAKNLEALRPTPHFLALVDYNSTDDVVGLVQTQSTDLQSGKLVYFRTEEPKTFHMSRAKNGAHRLALLSNPDVVFNLDADNFVTAETIAAVEATFSRQMNSVVHNWSTAYGDGSAGRIAVTAAAWKQLGGYDEQLLGMSFQDVDFLFRARALGLAYEGTSAGLVKAVENSLQQKLELLETPPGLVGLKPHEIFARLNVENLILSMKRPLRWSVDTQLRYRGRLASGAEIVV